ncbi:hypothetical protein CPC16_005716 [Podila verticillata]|nr:hypothetical protein BGZ59_001995 [Podila verticillata]KAF9389597.1 hypothetical protein CPC16_005716 [Podila verticillata]KAI9231842.1 MAG: Rhodanese-like domain-containing protein [Podila humilis]KFH66656.1 hypothetical protein MVEG_07181 [Podila verticillata NRRL 6337]
MAAQQPTFVDSHVLEELLNDKTKVPRKDYLIIDVRDADYIGGHIPGCLNVPAHDLPDQLPQLIEEYKNVPQLFFHCALSQVRGPKAAKRWSQALNAAAASNPEATAPAQKINILRGGFGAWQRKHKDNKVLVEDYQEEYWIEDF